MFNKKLYTITITILFYKYSYCIKNFNNIDSEEYEFINSDRLFDLLEEKIPARNDEEKDILDCTEYYRKTHRNEKSIIKRERLIENECFFCNIADNSEHEQNVFDHCIELKNLSKNKKDAAKHVFSLIQSYEKSRKEKIQIINKIPLSELIKIINIIENKYKKNKYSEIHLYCLCPIDLNGFEYRDLHRIKNRLNNELNKNKFDNNLTNKINNSINFLNFIINNPNY